MIDQYVLSFGKTEDKSLSITDIASIVLAIVNLFLACYIFVYQRNKDKKSDRSTAIINQKNLNIQWFKDLIIEPHFDLFIRSFEVLINHQPQFVAPNQIGYDEAINSYIAEIKGKVYLVRRNFLTLFSVVNQQLFTQSRDQIDVLLDSITKKLIDDRLDISDPKVFEEKIIQEIVDTKNKLISLIYNFKG